MKTGITKITERRRTMNTPIFIIGNPRSGTTLLRLMLTCHPRIVIPPECGFAVWLHGRYGDWDGISPENRIEAFVGDLLKCKKIETWKLDRDALRRALAERSPGTYSEVVDTVYRQYAAARGRAEAARWGDKNNYYLGHIDLLYRLFPEAHFVHIVRDPRGIVRSYKNVMKTAAASEYAPDLPSETSEIVREWVGNIERIRRSFDAAGWRNVTELTFEDLVSRSEDTLRRLCGRLGESYDPAMLDYPDANRRDELEPRAFLQWKEKTLCAPDPGVADAYRCELDTEDLERIGERAGPLMTVYGYD